MAVGVETIDFEVGAVVIVLFAGCMGSLIGSLVVFIVDIDLSLSALKLEIASDEERKARRPEPRSSAE